MRIVVDANVLLAALRRDSVTRRLLLDPQFKFIAPLHLVEEVSRHLKQDAKYVQKLEITGEEAREVATLLLEAIEKIPEKEYAALFPQALKLAPHEEDAPYLALALATPAPLWTYDKGMGKQSEVRVLSTSELLRATARR